MSPKIQKLIQKDSNLRHWRQKTATLLMMIGMSDHHIENALLGNLDKPFNLKSVCDAENISYELARQILGI